MIRYAKNIYHLLVAYIACIYYGFPSRKLKVIGITGTDGKTTSSFLIYHILKSAGKKVSVMTTVSTQVGEGLRKSGLHTTNPRSFMIQKYLKTAADDGHAYFVLETTSHALDQNKMFGIQFEVGLITNITHDHLDYHKTYENYVKAKVKLVQNAKVGIINRDDKSYEPIVSLLNHSTTPTPPNLGGELKGRYILTYSLHNPADYKFDISEKIGQPLAEYNKYNYLGVYAVCKNLGLSDEAIFAAMKTYQLPSGRFEVVYDKDFKVVVDYAHTPNALIQLLKAVKDLLIKKEGRIIHIFGATGHRDKLKRPILGESSGEYADLVILTEEDPETEDPVALAYVIAQGLQKKGFSEVKNEEFGSKQKTFTVIADRRKAIEKAVNIVQQNDVIVLTGMGHQKVIVRKNGEEPWVEQEIVKDVIANATK